MKNDPFKKKKKAPGKEQKEWPEAFGLCLALSTQLVEKPGVAAEAKAEPNPPPSSLHERL